MTQAGIRSRSSGQRKSGRKANHFGVIMIVLTAVALTSCARSKGLRVIGLRTEHMVNPVGIGTAQPHLSWTIQSDARNCTQSA